MKLNDTLSAKKYSYEGSEASPMERYPVTNLKFSLIVSLHAGEGFMRIRPSVENPSKQTVGAEAWLSTTFPIDQASQIISQQHLRFRRDDWCFKDLPNVINMDAHELLNYPQVEQHVHILRLPCSRWQLSCCQYCPGICRTWRSLRAPQLNHKHALHKALVLGCQENRSFSGGRPAGEYYEPWFSAFNSHFFQTYDFLPSSTSHWEAALLPIEGGSDE